MTHESFGVLVPYYWDCAYCQATNRNARTVCFACGLSEADARWQAGIAIASKVEERSTSL